MISGLPGVLGTSREREDYLVHQGLETTVILSIVLQAVPKGFWSHLINNQDVVYTKLNPIMGSNFYI